MYIVGYECSECGNRFTAHYSTAQAAHEAIDRMSKHCTDTTHTDTTHTDTTHTDTDSIGFRATDTTTGDRKFYSWEEFNAVIRRDMQNTKGGK